MGENANSTAPVLLSVRDVAARLGVSVATVRRWIAVGDLDAVRLGERAGATVRVPERALLRFVHVRDTMPRDAA